ncbi:MAG: tetratricopeptide repeat protein [Candidatus Caenarcaniphilales bacterium]|nr:tetratricopeptide repeat protein [Candidatus Caenarcaniphilales bacterium]
MKKRFIRTKSFSIFLATTLTIATVPFSLSSKSELNNNAVQYYSMALQWMRNGNDIEASNAFQKAIALAPNDGDIRANFADFLTNTGKTQEALMEYANAVRLAPNKGRIRVLYGRALLKAGSTDEAIEQLMVANQLEPNFPFISLNLGEAEQQAGAFDKSIFHLERALKEDPKNRKTLRLLAIAYHNTKQYPQAVNYYQQILALAPNDEWSQTNLARTYFEAGDLVSAEKAYAQLIQQKTDRADLLSAYAEIQYKKGNLQTAINLMNNALILQPNDPNLHAVLASYLEKQNNYSASVEHYRAATQLEKNPQVKTKYLLSEAQLLYKNKKYDQASAIIEDVLSKDPDNINLKTQLADIRLWQKKYPEAVALYREALALTPSLAQNKDLLFNYGASLMGIKDWVNAEVVWNNYVKLNSQSREAWFNLGLSQESIKKYSLATESYFKAIELGYPKVELLERVANYQVKSGNLAAAETTYRELILTKPENSTYPITLSRILNDLGRNDDAMEVLRKAPKSNNNIRLELAEKIAKSGDFYTAATEFQKVLERDINNSRAIIGLADSYSSIGQYSEAITLYEKYLETNSSELHARYNYASALANIGKETKAIEEFKKASNIDPSYGDTYYSLGALLLNRDASAARVYWQKYLDLEPQGEYKSDILHHFPDLK